MSPNKAKFLEAYKAICAEYGFIVDACGCCNSPFLTEIVSEASSAGQTGVKETLDHHISHLETAT